MDTSGGKPFRQQLITNLRRAALDDQLAAFQREYPFIDAKSEVVEAFLSDYSDDLLEYPPFCAEFSATELALVRGFIRTIRKDRHHDWPHVQIEAKRLLLTLDEK
ncbi:MAG: hypothetical protein GIKADHBN_01152 [Phycisphaerales bacterium]|nr:hypothetical protein [Phycisphaerales bacterium]